jgi:hypothetical protein
MYRARKATAVLCIVAVLFAACLPGFATTVGCAVLVALWLVLPPALSARRASDRSRAAEQPASLLFRLPSRGPPATFALT